MANIKKYMVEHAPTGGSITVEIDFDFVRKMDETESWDMNRMIREMVEFWHGCEERLAENNGDYVKTYLIQLCSSCIELYDSLGVKKLIQEVNDSEGYFKVDGSDGIKLIEFNEPEFDNQEDFEITEMK